MNRSNPGAVLVIAMAAAAVVPWGTAASADAQDAGPSGFDLSWHTIDCGGGTSTSASFEVSATLGQPDPGVMSGGGFTLAGGFHALPLGEPIDTCPADVVPLPNGDGLVNVDDLVAIILAWGPCPGCAADIAPEGGNGEVNVDDLVAVILAWGECQ